MGNKNIQPSFCVRRDYTCRKKIRHTSAIDDRRYCNLIYTFLTLTVILIDLPNYLPIPTLAILVQQHKTTTRCLCLDEEQAWIYRFHCTCFLRNLRYTIRRQWCSKHLSQPGIRETRKSLQNHGRLLLWTVVDH